MTAPPSNRCTVPVTRSPRCSSNSSNRVSRSASRIFWMITCLAVWAEIRPELGRIHLDPILDRRRWPRCRDRSGRRSPRLPDNACGPRSSAPIGSRRTRYPWGYSCRGECYPRSGPDRRSFNPSETCSSCRSMRGTRPAGPGIPKTTTSRARSSRRGSVFSPRCHRAEQRLLDPSSDATGRTFRLSREERTKPPGQAPIRPKEQSRPNGPIYQGVDRNVKRLEQWLGDSRHALVNRMQCPHHVGRSSGVAPRSFRRNLTRRWLPLLST